MASLASSGRSGGIDLARSPSSASPLTRTPMPASPHDTTSSTTGGSASMSASLRRAPTSATSSVTGSGRHTDRLRSGGVERRPSVSIGRSSLGLTRDGNSLPDPSTLSPAGGGGSFPYGMADSVARADPDMIEWLKRRVAMLDKYVPSLWNDEHDAVASDFLGNPNVPKLIVFIDRDLGLCLHTLHLSPLKKVKQILYFLKPSNTTVVLNKDNIEHYIQFGTLGGGAPMNSLLKMMNGLYLPTFLNNGTWPEGVKKEFSGSLHKFMASLTQTANEVKNHTVLYLPESEDLTNIERASKDKDLVQRLETLLIHWTRQIKEVSNQETSHHVDTSGPLEEIEFWRSRTIDLSGIRSQIDRAGVRRIVEVLRAAGSGFLKQFETLSDIIQKDSIEAHSNLKFLSVLQKPCEKLAEASPAEIPALLPEILNLIRVIWTISEYYRTTERLTGLIRKVSNQIILQCSKKISLDEIFDGDVEQSMVHLRQSMACTEAWHQIHDKTVLSISRAVDRQRGPGGNSAAAIAAQQAAAAAAAALAASTEGAKEAKAPGLEKWDYDAKAHGIFAQIDAFVQRCINLGEVCEGQLQFARKRSGVPRGEKVELPAFGGSRGPEIEKSLHQIEEAFNKRIERLRQLDYDILNVKATGWLHDYNVFKNALKDLDVMMSNVISSAWEGVSTVQAGVELLESFSYLAVRKGMKEAVAKKTVELWQMFKEELKQVKSDFDKHKKEPPVPHGWPRYAGAALWAKTLLTRINGDMKVLQDAHFLSQGHEAKDAIDTWQQYVSALEGFMRQCHTSWTDSLNQAAADHAALTDRLERPLMLRPDDTKAGGAGGHSGPHSLVRKTTGHLESNFDQHLLRLFNEVRYWEKFRGDFPINYHAHEMYLQQDSLRVLRESVMLVVRDYNTIVDALSPDLERRLFSEHTRRVDRIIQPGLSKLTWAGTHIKDWFVKNCRLKCAEVYDIVLKFKDNHERILHNCSRIGDLMLLDIEKNVVYDDVVFEQRQLQHHKKMRAELELLHLDIVHTIKASYSFFANDPKEVQREWMKYVKRIDQKVVSACSQTVLRSLQELSRAINGDSKTEAHALFKVDMILDEVNGKVDIRPTMKDLSEMITRVSAQQSACIRVIPWLSDVLAAEMQQAAQEQAEAVKFADAQQVAPTKGVIASQPKRAAEEKKNLVASVIEEDDEDGKRGGSHSGTPRMDIRVLTTANAAAAAASSKGPTSVAQAALAAGDGSGGNAVDTTTLHYAVVALNNEVLKTMSLILNGSTNVTADLGKLITHYDRFTPIWNTDKNAFMRRYANTKRPLQSFEMDINRYRGHQTDIQSEDALHTEQFIRVDCTKLKASLVGHCLQWQNNLTRLLHSNAKTDLNNLHESMTNNITTLQNRPDTLPALAAAIQAVGNLAAEMPTFEARFDPVEETYKALANFDYHIPEEEKLKVDKLRTQWSIFQGTHSEADTMLKMKKEDMRKEHMDSLSSFNQLVLDTRTEFKDHGPFGAPGPEGAELDGLEKDIDAAFSFIVGFKKRINDNRDRAESMKKGVELFGGELPEVKETDDTERELLMLEKVWTLFREWLTKWQQWKGARFSELVVKDLQNHAKSFQKNLQRLGRGVRQWRAWQSLYSIIGRFDSTLPLITDLRSPAMRSRHWEQLQEEIQQSFNPNAEDFTLGKVTALGIHLHAEVIHNLAQVAQRELNIENQLKDIASTWETQKLDLQAYKGGKYYKLRTVDDINDQLESHQMILTGMKNGAFYLTFSKDINYWVRTLNDIGETLDMLRTVQQQWSNLENTFMDSADIRKQLPAESSLFDTVNNHWVAIMNKLAKPKPPPEVTARAADILKDGLLERLTRMNETLDKINHSLAAYLEKKRQEFPRFYFLSDEDLLEILGQSRDPTQVQKHIHKCFSGLKALELVRGARCYEVKGLLSQDGESMAFNNPVFVEGEVESWLRTMEVAIQDTLQKQLYIACAAIQKFTHKKKNHAPLEAWVKGNLGQLVIMSGQIVWTARCGAAISDLHKNKRAMKALRSEWLSYLAALASYVRRPLTPQERSKLNALITIEIHARDVIDRLKTASKTKLTLNSFDWTSQLRFYFDTKQGEYGKCVVKQTNTKFNYGYEYIGQNNRLVITPLTDRCYMTLTTALNLNRGGNPTGPAGTGKTESVKDLGKALGKLVVVFNCSPKMGVDSLGRNFSGLAQTGAWGCFDEFNRITIEVLSVVALQIGAILEACRHNVKEFMFEGHPIRLDRSVGIFITMNPGYAGRTELPENLQSLFRPVAMMVPDSQLIAEIMLQSEGFKEAQALSKKIITIYDLMTKQLSKQNHYNYGLRAIKSVLVRAGILYRRKEPDLGTEELVLMRALRDMNAPKMVIEDVPLFDGLLSDLFPNTELPSLNYPQLRAEIENQLKKEGLQVHEGLIAKIIQLFETKGTRHGNMLVGDTCSGKTTAWKILARALTALSEEKSGQWDAVEVHVMNPKAVDVNGLYGYYDPLTKEWQDGILNDIMRRVCNDNTTKAGESTKEKWIILDGPVDTLWIESMNTVLDETKMLTPVNGDRIAMPKEVSMLFEVQDLAVASPATVSRCGMVYMDSDRLGWKPFVQSWLAAKYAKLDVKTEDKEVVAVATKTGASKKGGVSSGGDAAVFTKEAIDLLAKLVETYLVPVMAFRRNEPDLRELIPISDFNAVQSHCRLFDALATVDNGVDVTDEPNYLRMINMWFVFCVLWSCGGAFDDASRRRLDVFIRDLEAQFPPRETCYEYYVDPVKKEWELWDSKVNNAWRPSPNMPFYKILVPTVDTVRHSFLLNALINARQHTLIVGATGTGKTSIIQSVLEQQQVNSNTLTLTLNFSAATSSEGLQEMLESRLEKRQRNNYGPLGARARLITFIDDLNMPAKTEFGSQPPIELLRQWIEHGFWYDRKALTLKVVKDMQLLAAMGPPGGARSTITPRFQSKFNLINFTMPNDSQIKRIFNRLIVNHLSNFDEIVKPLGPIMTNATLDLYKQAVEDFKPAPSSSHYLFNLRDMSKVFQGLLQSDAKNYDTRENMIRLWVHECMRVFHDRLVSDEDRNKLMDWLDHNKLKDFETNWKKLFKEARQPMFGDFIDDEATPTLIADEKEEDRAPYVDLSAKRKQVKKLMEDKLTQYNQTADNNPQDLVLFDSAINHVARVYRIITLPRGSAMLVGVGGSGRQSCARLAAYMAGMKVKQITPSKNYRVQDFREELKELFKQCAGIGLDEPERTVFLISDTQLVHESMLEDINNILNSGEVPKLFPQEELAPILEDMRTEISKDNKDSKSEAKSYSEDALYQFFIERVRTNLHVVLCMSPVGAAFRARVRMFPALVNCTTIDWFSEWPEVALQDVAAKFLADVDVGDEKRSKKLKTDLSAVFVSFHQSALETKERMFAEVKRQYYITPTKFLDLVKSYRSLLHEKRTRISSVSEKLRNGLSKFDETNAQVAKMQIELKEKEAEVELKKQACDRLLIAIVGQKRAAEEQRKQVETDKVKAEDDAKEHAEIQREASEELDKVTPSLNKAIEALEKLSPAAVREVKAYARPPKPVEKVMAAVMVLLEKDTSWPSARREISDPSFLRRLQDFERDKISNTVLKQVNKYTKHPDFNADEISNVSQAAGALCDWVCAMEQYARVFRDVEPRRVALRKADAKMKKKQEKVDEAEAMLSDVTSKVAKLESKHQASEAEKNEFKAAAQMLKSKLVKAAKLVEGLSGERLRWEQQIKNCESDVKSLIGDCALAAAFLAYAGPFPSQYRDQLNQKWLSAIKKAGLPYSNEFDFVSFLAEATDVLDWHATQGLPSDMFSTENGVLTMRGIRWPLMIDPQGQANSWIKNKEGKRKGGPALVVLDLSSDKYLPQLEMAIQTGAPVLIQDVSDDLDPALDPILSLSLGVGEEVKSIVLGDRDLQYHPNFRLYLTTKLANPTYKPETAIRTTIVNFAVKEKGLQDQLLGIVVKLEEPKLEAEKASLIKTVAASKRLLVELENQILTLLQKADDKAKEANAAAAAAAALAPVATPGSTASHAPSSSISGGESKWGDRARFGVENKAEERPPGTSEKREGKSLLDDDDLITALNESKATSEKTEEQLRTSQKTEEKIDLAREGYRPVAVRAAICFFVLNDLALVDPMYQFSLRSYIQLFTSSIQDSKDEKGDTPDLPERIVTLNNYHTEAVYKFACRALFEKHKLLFSFQLCIQRMRSEGKIDGDEYDFFLRGGQVLDRSLRPPNPCAEWLSEAAWDSITELDKLPVFKNLVHSFEQNPNEWRSWYRNEETPPERLPTPGDFQTKRDDFQQMLILRCLRPDRVVFAARHFIAQNLGAQFVESPPFILSQVYRVSSATTPLIFVLSPGVDPNPQLIALARAEGKQLEVLALGQGQTPIATQLIDHGVRNGNWVFLANCHLSISWLPELEKIVEQISLGVGSSGIARSVHPNFRLWLSSDPHPDFPISLLQNSVKMTTEPPKGLRANLQRLYANITDEQFNRCRKPERYKKLLYALCYFHSIVVERRKFLTLGWNVPYAFSDSDFTVCENILSVYLDDNEETPWDALRYLIAQCNYGGRVTDNLDRRLLQVYINQYFTEQALTVPKFALSSSETYFIPDDGSLDSYRKHIALLPKADQDPPEAFGQHANADIASQMDETKTLLGTILSLQPRIVVTGGKSREKQVLELIIQLLEQVPLEFDIKAVQRRHEMDKSPLTTVLLQEISRYNELLSEVTQSLHDLRRSITGEVVISPELELMFECLFTAQVPPSWQSAYPSVMPLAFWIRDLGARVSQLRRWADDEPPKVFWLSGFTFPVGFLTALLQTSARRNGVSIDTLSWDFVVMTHNEASINMKPKEGAYIKGLYLEGARWDPEGCLAEPYAMELYSDMPIIHFKPVTHRKSGSKGLHATPLYTFPVRGGTRDGRASFMMEVDLKHGAGPHDSQFWTKRGVALLLALDH